MTTYHNERTMHARILCRSIPMAIALWVALLFAVVAGAQPDPASENGPGHYTTESSQPPVDLVVVLKSDRVLYLYADGEMVDQYPIALGKDPIGPKRQRGDNKTPEGLYRLDWRNPDSIFHRSIHVSYPNEKDRAASRRLGVNPGDLIMIHGQPDYDDREREGDWTNGCIAVSNAAINEIWQRVPDDTRIHIYP